jgi:hypothetical protein
LFKKNFKMKIWQENLKKRADIFFVPPSKITGQSTGFSINSGYRSWEYEGKVFIREGLPGVEHAGQIRHLHNLNPDILHIPDIGPMHLF